MEQMRYFGGCGVVGWMKKFIVWNEWKEGLWAMRGTS